MIWTKNKAPLKSTATLADLDGKMLKNRFWEALKLEKCRDGPCHKEFDVKRKGPKNWSSHSKLMVHPKTLEAFWSVLVTSGRYLRNSFLTRGFKVTCFGHLICVFLSHKNVSIFDTETYKSCKCEYVYIHVCVIQALNTLFPNTSIKNLRVGLYVTSGRWDGWNPACSGLCSLMKFLGTWSSCCFKVLIDIDMDIKMWSGPSMDWLWLYVVARLWCLWVHSTWLR